VCNIAYKFWPNNISSAQNIFSCMKPNFNYAIYITSHTLYNFIVFVVQEGFTYEQKTNCNWDYPSHSYNSPTSNMSVFCIQCYLSTGDRTLYSYIFLIFCHIRDKCLWTLDSGAPVLWTCSGYFQEYTQYSDLYVVIYNARETTIHIRHLY